MTCPHRDVSLCRIASQIAGRAAPVTDAACDACLKSSNPRQINEVTIGVAIVANRTDKAHGKRILDQYGHLIPAAAGVLSSQAQLDAVHHGTGVGSHLWRILTSLGVRHTAGCSCLALAAEMNRLGPEGCRTERSRLAKQMGDNADQYGWGTVATAAAKAILSGLAWRLDLLDLYGSLLDEAIRRTQEAVGKRQQLILASNLCPGDLLTMTAAIESLHLQFPGRYLTDVRTNHPQIWAGNPHISPIADGTPGSKTIQMHYPSIHACNQVAVPFLAGYTSYLAEQLGIPLALRTNRPHLYLTPDEERRARSKLWDGAPDLSGPYWIINAGIKQDFTVKQWPVEYYQSVVDATRGKITWVQIGLSMHDHPRLRGVVSLLDTGPPMRQLILLARHAAGGLGPITFLQHLMAAWERPYICLAGGREPTTWIQYPEQHTLHTVGQLDCCRTRACWKGRVVALKDGAKSDESLCVHPVTDMRRPVPRCMQLIRPEEVLAILARSGGQG